MADRLRKGWSKKKASETFVKQVKLYKYKGKKLTFNRLLEISGLKKTTLERRVYDYGWSIERAVDTPARQRLA